MKEPPASLRPFVLLMMLGFALFVAIGLGGGIAGFLVVMALGWFVSLFFH